MTGKNYMVLGLSPGLEETMAPVGGPDHLNHPGTSSIKILGHNMVVACDLDAGHPYVYLQQHGPGTSTQTTTTIGPYTQTCSLAAAWASLSSLPQVAV